MHPQFFFCIFWNLSFLLFPAENLWGNTRTWVLNFLYPYCMELAFFHEAEWKLVFFMLVWVVFIIYRVRVYRVVFIISLCRSCVCLRFHHELAHRPGRYASRRWPNSIATLQCCNPYYRRIQGSVNDEVTSVDEDSFFELLTRFQSKRMDDQRCTLEGGDAPAQPLHNLLENDDGAPTFNGGLPAHLRSSNIELIYSIVCL